MPVDPHVAAVLAALADLGAPPMHEGSAADRRAWPGQAPEPNV